MEPKILVLDEPTAGLDPQGREDILALIKKLKEEVCPTIIIVTHNMDEIAKEAGHIIALFKGEIVYNGTPLEVFSHEDFKEKTRLEYPTATYIANEIRKQGVDIKQVVTPEELVSELARIKEGKNV